MEELQAVVERLGGAAELVGDRMGCPELTDDIRTLCDAVTLMGCGHPRMFWVTEAVAFDAIDAGYGYCSACRSQQDAVAAADKQLREADAMLWAMNKGVFRSGERIAELEAELTALRSRLERVEGLIQAMPHEFISGGGGKFTTLLPNNPNHKPGWCYRCVLTAALGDAATQTGE